jgi:hypothetical protein
MGEFLNPKDEGVKLIPKVWSNQLGWLTYVRVICGLLESINTNHYENLERALLIQLPPPSRPALQAFLNDIYDPEQKGIQVDWELEISSSAIVKANILVYLPPVLLGSSFFPSDINYIQILLKNLTRLGLDGAGGVIFTGFSLYFNDGSQDFTFFFIDENNQNITFYFNEILNTRKI